LCEGPVSLLDNNRCFACGKENPIGLRLEFREEGDGYVAEFTPKEEHQGYAQITHGGIVATLLDEAMARFAWVRGLNAVTARIAINYRRPARVGERLTVRGRIDERNRKLCKCSAEVTGEDGVLIADAEATLVITGD
jgi:uncharacterized protein (TIGR00369 family)